MRVKNKDGNTGVAAAGCIGVGYSAPFREVTILGRLGSTSKPHDCLKAERGYLVLQGLFPR